MVEEYLWLSSLSVHILQWLMELSSSLVSIVKLWHFNLILVEHISGISRWMWTVIFKASWDVFDSTGSNSGNEMLSDSVGQLDTYVSHKDWWQLETNQ